MQLWNKFSGINFSSMKMVRELLLKNYNRPSITNNQFQITNHQSPISNFNSPITNHRLPLFLILSIFTITANAQWQPHCQDSMRKNPFYQCQEPFRPVCGCDFKTYRNECESYNIYGINTIFSDGVCKNDIFYYDFYPNPAVEKVTYNIKFFDQGNYTVQIFDTYGKLMYYEHQASINERQNDIYLGSFKPGLYIFNIISGSKFKSEKLIVK